ncbi:hypothetical protein chiPu_0032337 [Chiloscyllium punctatum]|uniref:Uncharacterized protein n=1 Tax=Chiloscyllium punctatum TaxID=137246 RepID=A0A401TZU4_CHIPU|nr:hypothetical protein [Chiloscyllium punctatum]
MSPAECHEACSSFALGKAEAGTGTGNRFGSVTDACTWRRVGERTSARRRGRHSPEQTPARPSHRRGGLGVAATAHHTRSHTLSAACPQATDHRSTPGALTETAITRSPCWQFAGDHYCTELENRWAATRESLNRHPQPANAQRP